MMSHEPPHHPDDPLLAALKSTFGHTGFRPLQRDIVEASLAGRDVVAILPTGAGKSLCYQLPAILRDGLTLVISPLIALMKDQVDALLAAGVPATFLNSSLPSDEAARRRRLLQDGAYRLLYAAPERVMAPGFVHDLRRWGVSAVAVDEAHCISAWGHDFRPEYRQLASLRRELDGVPFLAMTATATPEVRHDIADQLELNDPVVFQASFNRPNLRYAVTARRSGAGQLVDFVRARKDASGVVYCRSRDRTEEVAAALNAAGVRALAYHAGLEAGQRARNQEAFIRDEVQVVCATVAFGMGIDKPDVRFVLHADMPKNLEGYYQETGRAGRDGLPSECLLLFGAGDVAQNLHFLRDLPDDAAAIARRQLQAMAAFAESARCRRAELLAWFGERWPEDGCGACDNCEVPRETFDGTVEAQKLLSCVLRIAQHGSRPTGLAHVVDVLLAKRGEQVLARRHDTLSTWGIGAGTTREIWMSIGRQLVAGGHLVTSEDRWATVSVSALGRQALSERRPFTFSRPLAKATASAASRGSAGTTSSGGRKGPEASRADLACDEALFEVLRALRKQEADARGWPPYVVFGDAALRHMARAYPTTAEAFLAIPGVGLAKSATFGATFTTAIADWLASNTRESLADEVVTSRVTAAAGLPRETSATAHESAASYRVLRSPEAVATARGLQLRTIHQHLAEAIANGDLDASPRDFYPPEVEAELAEAAQVHGLAFLKPLHDALGGRVPYETLSYFRAFARRPS